MKSHGDERMLVLTVLLVVGSGLACPPKAPPAAGVQPITNAFQAALQRYVEATRLLRETTEKEVPEGKTPEEQARAVERRRGLLAVRIRAMRAQAKEGDLLTPYGIEFIRRRLALSFEGPGVGTIRDALEEQNDPSIYKTLPSRIELGGSPSIPLLPAVLMDDLPPIPDQVEYRFAGRTLVLADAEAGIVLDYLPEVFPEPPSKAPPTETTAAVAPKAFAYLSMPRKANSVRFADLGDTGTGDANQRRVAEMLWDYYSQNNRFKFILLLGDNLYAGMESAADYERQFLQPYKTFLDARVQFHATLGNHDLAGQADFKPFNMGGHPYYSFKEGNVKFVSLNSNDPTEPKQLAWLDEQFAREDGWRICFFHHPLYSSGVHAQESAAMRTVLEAPLARNKVNVVFNGHEHFYERPKPQKGIHYFVDGASAKLRRGNLQPREFTAFGYDAEHSLMIVEIAGDAMFFQALGVSGRTIDCGVVYRSPAAESKDSSDAKTRGWLQECDAARTWLPARKP
jgi:hypothetical protein